MTLKTADAPLACCVLHPRPHDLAEDIVAIQPGCEAESLADSLRAIGELFGAVRRGSPVLIGVPFNGGSEWVGQMILGLLPRRWRPALVVSGDGLQLGAGRPRLIRRAILRVIDRAVHAWAFTFPIDAMEAAERWGIDPEGVQIVSWHPNQDVLDFAEGHVEDGDYVFSAGNTRRDYEPVLDAARRAPDLRFIIATSLLDDRPDIPPNVRVGSVDREEYARLLAQSAAVVVPVDASIDMASGMSVYLEAMALGKPTVVNDAFAVRAFLDHGRNGFVVDGSADSYVDVLRHVTGPWLSTTERRRVTDSAQERVRGLSYENHVAQIKHLVEEARTAA